MGGIPLKELREYIIYRYKLNSKDINKLDRFDLCHLISEIDKNFFKETDKINLNKKISKKKYKIDIEKCNLTVSKGGYNIKEIKQIAKIYYNINVNNLTKKEICELIKKKKKNKKYLKKKKIKQRKDLFVIH